MANFYLAFEQNLTIVPVINKIDLPTADIPRVAQELDTLFDFKRNEIIEASAKANIGITEILNAIITRIPAPIAHEDKPLKALLFDSWYDEYRGVICLIAIHDGSIKKGDSITLAQTNTSYEVLDIGLMYPEPTATGSLYAGQVGFIVTGMKTVQEARVGDTIFHMKNPVPALPGL